MKTWLALSLGVLVTSALAWPKMGSVSAAAQRDLPVQIIPPGQQQLGNPGEKGATYYAIEAQTTRLTTRFRDGHVAVTERGLVGDVRTTLRDQAGNERGRLRLNRVDSAHDTVTYEPGDGAPIQMVSDPNIVKPTLDWAARQAYGLAKDGAANLVWDAGTMRPRSAARRDVDTDVSEVETVWANGLVSTLTRQNYSRRAIAPGLSVQGPVMIAQLTENGVPAGTAYWFEQDQVFAYTLPGLMKGADIIAPEHLKANYGGWPFKPDTTWLNLQLIATHHFKTLLAKQGSVARACEPPAPSRLAQFFAPTLYADEPGCDGLHYLDGSMFRDCCDNHDRCYAKNGCDSSSFWLFWKSWSCDRCNLVVVGCFISRSQIDIDCLQRMICAG